MSLNTFRNVVHLAKVQQRDRSTIDRSQLVLLRELVACALRDVPLYRKTLTNCEQEASHLNSFDDLTHLPILTKDEIKAGFPDHILAEGKTAACTLLRRRGQPIVS